VDEHVPQEHGTAAPEGGQTRVIVHHCAAQEVDRRSTAAWGSNSFAKSGRGWEQYMEWYWDPYWLYFYWKNHLILVVLTIVLVMAFFAVSVLVIRRRIARIAAWRRKHSRP
jgi:hypothetical protein